MTAKKPRPKRKLAPRPHVRRGSPTEPTTKELRVAEVVDLMQSNEWLGRRSLAILAEKFGTSTSTIKDDAAEAERVIRGLYLFDADDLDTWKKRTIAENEDLKARALARVRLKARMVRKPVEVTNPDGSKSVQTVTVSELYEEPNPDFATVAGCLDRRLMILGLAPKHVRLSGDPDGAPIPVAVSGGVIILPPEE